jgi:PAS domain S-box-containing protein
MRSAYPWLGVVAAAAVVATLAVLLAGARRSLALSEARRDVLTRAADLIVVSLDATGERLAANEAWRAFTGLTGDLWREAIHPDDVGRVPPLAGGLVQVEVRLRHSSATGYHWVRLNLAPIIRGGRTSEWLGAIEDIDERKALEEQRHTLAEELAHRAKNGFAVIQAIVTQSARGAESVSDLEQVITSRLASMARAQELVSGSPEEQARLAEIMTGALEPFDIDRFDMAGDEVIVLGRNLSLTLALILHELATNALKYGALSTPEGRVAVEYRRPGEGGTVEVDWRERGGPGVRNTGKTGFGTRLVQASLGRFGGGAEIRMAADGLQCRLHFVG